MEAPRPSQRCWERCRCSVTSSTFSLAAEVSGVAATDLLRALRAAVHRPEEIGRSDAADLGRALNVELVSTEHRQRSQHLRLGLGASIHPMTVAPEYPAG